MMLVRFDISESSHRTYSEYSVFTKPQNFDTNQELIDEVYGDVRDNIDRWYEISVGARWNLRPKELHTLKKFEIVRYSNGELV
mgnify:CR=1 FL=1|tara:strand:+ start:273 stop:521 length:249 start_codon:yes stop_codon:yes gene_type:complete